MWKASPILNLHVILDFSENCFENERISKSKAKY